MTIEILLAILSFGVAVFSMGYMIGYNHRKKQ